MIDQVDAIFLDTETTQKKATPEVPIEVMELAWRDHRDRACSFSRRYRPHLPPAWGAMAIHGITMQDVSGCASTDVAKSDVPPATYWIGHNIDFDWNALGCPPVRRICTLALARSVFPELDSHTLDTVYYYINGINDKTREAMRNAHSALHDVDFCISVFDALCAKLSTHDLAELHEMSEEARIPKKMSFGKFIGEPISAVDRGYASWYARQRRGRGRHCRDGGCRSARRGGDASRRGANAA
jgi:exodeoxyribonuclease X